MCRDSSNVIARLTHRPQIAQVEELLRQVEEQLRLISHELRPTTLDDLGWLPAVRVQQRGRPDEFQDFVRSFGMVFPDLRGDCARIEDNFIRSAGLKQTRTIRISGG
jgi:hypothetical protein